MNNENGWRNRDYVMGRAEEYCRNRNCGWKISRDSSNGLDDSGRCPVCGEITDSAISFGGLTVI